MKSFLFYLFIFFYCYHTYAQSNNFFKKLINKQKLTIVIQPFDKFPQASANYIANQVKKVYSGSVVVKKPINFPINSLNSKRSRYRADSLIRFLSKNTSSGFLSIGLTNKDISTTKGKYQDWGIMGLGYCPGKSCIASTYRLKGNNQLDKLYKVAIHELGHTQGLAHCPEKGCLMRDAKGKDDLNSLHSFCRKCKAVLTKVGWSLN